MGFFKRFSRPKATLSLKMKNELSLGDELEGTVNLKSQEELDVERIIVSLTCVETIKKNKLVYNLPNPPNADLVLIPNMIDV